MTASGTRKKIKNKKQKMMMICKIINLIKVKKKYDVDDEDVMLLSFFK